MFSITQIRSLQGAVTALGTASAAERGGIYQTLVDNLRIPGRELEFPRLLPILYPPAQKIQGLLFRYREDPTTLTRLIFADSRETPLALHLKLPKSEQQPTLLGLHYVYSTRRHVGTAYYLLSGALMTYEDPDFEYSRLKRKTASIERLSHLLYKLNTPVADLPYPKGRNLSTLDSFKKMGIRYVGELICRSEEELKTHLGPMGWITVKSILHDLKLLPGMEIPEWKSPR